MVTVRTVGREAYERLRERDWGTPRVECLPDGSVDEYYEVYDGRDNHVASREAFGRLVAEGTSESVRLRPRGTEPGGQAVNAARQVDALGGEPGVLGHLDDPVLEGLPFPTRSMGDPARVDVLEFDAGAFMLSEESDDLRAWTPDDLKDVDPGFEYVRAADAVFAANWVSMPEVSEVLERFADVDGLGTVVFDPGDLTKSDPSEVSRLADSLSALAAVHRVVLSTNESEMRYVADTLAVEPGPLPERTEAVRQRTGVDTAVVHDEDQAIGASDSEVVRVPNLETETVRRTTGAGDRFDGGLAFGLADDPPLSSALALGNACASYYVATTETADADVVTAYVADSPLRE
ncbi:MAG: PfkB family carbohydrate kinase [Halobacterium sp.]